MNQATLLLQPTPGAQLTEVSVLAGTVPVRLRRGGRWTVIEAGSGLVLQALSPLPEVEIEFDPDGEMVGTVIERRADGSLWERLLLEDDWRWSGV